MTLITQTKASLRSSIGRMRQLGRVYLVGGLVGVLYAVRLSRNRSNMEHVTRCLMAERELHREHVTILNRQLQELARERQELSVDARMFWRDQTDGIGASQ